MKKMALPTNLPVGLLLACCVTSVAASLRQFPSLRQFRFFAQVRYAPLLQSLPNHTSIYHEWPRKELRKTLPKFIATALVAVNDESSDANNDDISLIGPPIHVQVGDILSVTLKNTLPTAGLSLHWHGFEMKDALEYDGVVGVTQCPISPQTQFEYNFIVDETPGTYWWHTHSGTLDAHAMNAIHGPLVVHPEGYENKRLVDKLNENDASDFYYENERILFFKDGFVGQDKVHLESKMGGLNEAVSKDDSGTTVGTSAWQFGTCNGRMREVVPVSAGETYKFRLINGGSHYGLRINVANLKMKIIAADSEPVEPMDVDEVFLHVAERFDVEVRVPGEWSGQFWIRADTVESTWQGYQNGIRAILAVSGSDGASSAMSSHEVYDPEDSIASAYEKSKDHVTMNCFQRETFDGAPSFGKCLQINELNRSDEGFLETQRHTEEPVEVHIIDSHWQPYPQHSHFIRINDGPFYQHVNPIVSMLDPAFDAKSDMHPHSAVLHAPAFSTVLMVWRTTSLMDHPFHLHGLKMEILDIALPDKHKDCSLSKCKLNSHYQSHGRVRDLAARIPTNKAVLKDTFIMPAGGAVVTRIHTQEPSLWYAHCHMEMHHFDGMAFILNVGNYSSPSRKLPDDMPNCANPFVLSQMEHPHCDCYRNPNSIMGNYLTAEGYKCSREHLCHHMNSRSANLEKNPFAGGDRIHSSYQVPGWAISLVVISLVCFVLNIMSKVSSMAELKMSSESATEITPETDKQVSEAGPTGHSEDDSFGSESRPETNHLAAETAEPALIRQRSNPSTVRSSDSPFFEQLNQVIGNQYKIYRPLCVNGLRVVEVCSLGLLTGFLFFDVGGNRSFVGLSQRLSLFFFSTTLWTFTRMYPSVGFAYQWSLLYQVDFEQKRFSVCAVVLGRVIVVLGLESFWPLVYTLVCYPLAGVFGSIHIAIMVGFFLLLNNLCYISLGVMLGVYSKKVPLGMIASTIISQTSLVAAGFYTKLPPALDWIRYISPFYWTFRGILKSCLRWNDTVECYKGSSDVGANQCYLEYHPAIDQYKERGINVAAFNDPSSESVHLEYTSLVLLLFFLNGAMFVKAWHVSRRKRESPQSLVPETRRLSRWSSVTDLILSRFNSGMDDTESDENDAGVDSESGNRGQEVSRVQSLRTRTLERLRSSNVFAFK